MGRLFLLIVVVVLAIATVPPLRSAVTSRLGPVVDGPIAAVKRPFQVWVARRETEHLLRSAREAQARGRLPTGARFRDFARDRLKEKRGGLDPWGSEYVLELRRDSLFVVSPGPDTTAATADDIRVGTRRN